MKNFFFYGSLRTGYWNQRVLSSKAIKVADAQTVEPHELYIGKTGTVPTAVPGGGTFLRGEVYSLNKEDERSVRALEAGYHPREIEVSLKDGEIVKATIFGHDKPEDCPYIRANFVKIPGDYTKSVAKNGERL